MFTKVKAVDPAPEPSKTFVVFLQIAKDGPIIEKIVEADRFEIDRRRSVVNFYVGETRDGYFRQRNVVGVVEAVEDEG